MGSLLVGSMLYWILMALNCYFLLILKPASLLNNSSLFTYPMFRTCFRFYELISLFGLYLTLELVLCILCYSYMALM
jgi:hypothetical protein